MSENPRPLTMREIGRKGGLSNAQRHGRDHFVEIGRKGGRRMKALIEAGKQSLQPEAQDAEGDH